MKHTRRKLVLIMLISMVVAFAVIALAFQLIIRSHVRSRAEESISLYMNMEDEDEEALREETESSMVVTSFTYQTEEELDEDSDDETNWWDEFWDSIFNEDYWNSEDVMQAYYSEEITAWWETNQPEEYSLNKVEINEKPLYVSWAHDAESESKIRFYYVNVSSEEQLIKTVSISLYIIMAICLAGACLAGFFMGKKIETDQNRQKQFFENASHELKTPLMSIQGYAEGLQAGIITEPEKATKVILNETDKMTGLVNDILSISRLESGAYKLKKEPVFMQEFLSECLTSMEAAIYEKRLRVSFDVAPYAIEADRTQLEKAVRNILSNAIRYARSEIRIWFDGKKLIIWDDGPPISEESLKHLFERFYTGQNGNTGIGMSLTKEIVEQHGWKIKAENTAAGAQFVITF
ncbi:MAG: HAMP domain-containing sensor histidine kinase [Lachnospiraceae bacterium]|nr:HAMP domain-containing sensor histidine kinase [Lachnospiraceae bacterium]